MIIFSTRQNKRHCLYSFNTAEQQKELQQMNKHYAAENKKPAARVFFMDDFSANADGDRPGRLERFKQNLPRLFRSAANPANGFTQLGHIELTAFALFEKTRKISSMEFDLATDAFSVRTGGALRLNLSSYQANAEGLVLPDTKGSVLEWQIAPVMKRIISATITAANLSRSSTPNCCRVWRRF